MIALERHPTQGYQAPTFNPLHVARVSYDHNPDFEVDRWVPRGWFLFVAWDDNEIIGKGGADNEILTLPHLVDKSRFIVDWYSPIGKAILQALQNESMRDMHSSTKELFRFQ